MPSVRTRALSALFGLSPAPSVRRGAPGAPLRERAARLDRALAPGQIALITGPSGCGKSTLLAALERRLARRSTVLLLAPSMNDPRDDRALADRWDGLQGGRVRDTLDALAAAGLAEARLLALPARALSDGQRARLRLADAVAQTLAAQRRGEPPAGVTILLDEFASTLDRVTARSACVALARWVRRGAPRVRAVCATAHTDVEAWLAPDAVVRLAPLDGPGADGAPS